MATQFSIDDAFVLEGEEEGVGPGGDLEGWKGKEKEKDGEMTFGTLSFTKPQTHPATVAGSPEHSNLKYQNLENEDVLGNSGSSTFNNFFKISSLHHVYQPAYALIIQTESPSSFIAARLVPLQGSLAAD